MSFEASRQQLRRRRELQRPAGAGWGRFDVGVRYLVEMSGKLLTIRGRMENLADRNCWASVGG